ncbi:cation diffusion facilitator family transporter [Hahella sp. SMD15-11]|uniref:Cation diffusion facilitator family transporter n=1 Tax=Thermohahella caldifontis TaxID=3142973 RepID=A0AB39USL4_9GAMM
MGHAHDHDHDHAGHHHAPKRFDRAFALGVALNTGFVVVEAAWGVWAGSLALIADAGHNLSDVLSLLLAWGAATLARRSGSQRRTYGLRKTTVLAAVISALMLLVALGAMTWEALERLANPAEVASMPMILVALVGVVINTATALLFLRGQETDLNVRGAYLHMAADAAVSLGVVIAGILIMQTGWFWVDPLITLIIVLVILVGTWQLLTESLDALLDATPRHIDLDAVQEALLAHPQVTGLHDLHVWPLSTSETALTAHLQVRQWPSDNRLIQDLNGMLNQRFGIRHATLQIETADDGPACHLDQPNCSAPSEQSRAS